MRTATFLLFLAACVPNRRIEPPEGFPPGFVPVDPGEFSWRAMSAHGVVIGLRSRPRDPAGTLDFWSTVVQKELEAKKGYALQSTDGVTARDTPGKLMLFSAPGEQATTFLLGLFLTDSRIYTFEGGGPRRRVDEDLRELKGFLARLSFE